MQNKLLLLSGMGPVWPEGSSFWDSNTLAGTFFDRKAANPHFHAGLGRSLSTNDFLYRTGTTVNQLIRPRVEKEPHLTSETLCSLLDAHGRDYELFRLEDLWFGDGEPATNNPHVVALSTTYIYNRKAMNAAVTWIGDRYPQATLVVGGQYSNLKYTQLMRDYPTIDFIVRGDAEISFPMLLDALEGRAQLGHVPNLVIGGAGGQLRQVTINEFEYIDLDQFPSPRFRGQRSVVPYESMRGCPFTCKFCSFPFASPKWRYKSAEKITRDWASYAEVNGATRIYAMDSTFTVPPTRLQQLFKMLPAIGVSWEAYTRANSIKSQKIVDSLTQSNCLALSIGFESMSDVTLKHMNKRVKAEHNRRAHDLLCDSTVDFRSSFIIGYPGETTDEYQKTHRFIVDDLQRRFHLSVFSLTDETMPVWADAELHQLAVDDPNDPDSDRKHVGMDVATARELHQRTIREVRWKNERAIAVQWQMPYQLPLLPQAEARASYRVEKLLERLAFAPRDMASEPERMRSMSRSIVAELAQLGVIIGDERQP